MTGDQPGLQVRNPGDRSVCSQSGQNVVGLCAGKIGSPDRTGPRTTLAASCHRLRLLDGRLPGALLRCSRAAQPAIASVSRYRCQLGGYLHSALRHHSPAGCVHHPAITAALSSVRMTIVPRLGAGRSGHRSQARRTRAVDIEHLETMSGLPRCGDMREPVQPAGSPPRRSRAVSVPGCSTHNPAGGQRVACSVTCRTRSSPTRRRLSLWLTGCFTTPAMILPGGCN